MKNYLFTLSVPDNFDPKQLSIDIQYPDEVEIVKEGFASDYTELLKDLNIEKLNLADKDVVIFKFKPTSALASDLVSLNIAGEYVEDTTSLPVLVLLDDDISVYAEEASTTIPMLEGMIAKIKARCKIQPQKKQIVLP